jgi:hypothetical protein
MQNRLWLIGIGLVVGCQTIPEVKFYDPLKHCDVHMMERAKSLPRDQYVSGAQVGKVLDAYSECGEYTHGIARDNTAAAEELKEKVSRFQPAKDYALMFETAILIALGIAAALL